MRPELGQLVQGLLLRLLGHPVEVDDGAPVGLDQVGHQRVHPLLGRRGEVPLDVEPADRLAERALDQGDAPLPALAQLRGAGQHRPVEGEVLVHEPAGQVRRPGVDQPPARPGPPGRQPILGQQHGDLGEEGGLHGHQLRHRRFFDVGPGQELSPVQTGGVVGELVQGHQVVHLPQIPALDLVPVGRGDVGLQLEDLPRLLGRIGQARQLEGTDHVVAVVVADRGMLGQPVISLVGQPQAALAGEHHVAQRVAGIGLGVHPDQPVHPAPDELTEQLGQVHRAADRIDRRQHRRQRLGAGGLDRVGIHEAGVQIGDLGRVGPRRALGQGGDDDADGFLGLVAQLHERAGQRLVGRDLGGAQPRPVDVPEQVVLDADLGVEGGEVERRRRVGRLDHPAMLVPPSSGAPALRSNGP